MRGVVSFCLATALAGCGSKSSVENLSPLDADRAAFDLMLAKTNGPAETFDDKGLGLAVPPGKEDEVYACYVGVASQQDVPLAKLSDGIQKFFPLFDAGNLQMSPELRDIAGNFLFAHYIARECQSGGDADEANRRLNERIDQVRQEQPISAPPN